MMHVICYVWAGTGIVLGKKGQHVWTDGNDSAALSKGIYDTYTKTNLRYSQVAPIDMFTEKNTGSNLPAQIDLFSTAGDPNIAHVIFILMITLISHFY